MIENNFDLIANDALLPSQLTQNASTPEKKLHAAILIDAVQIYQRGPCKSASARRTYQDTVKWLFAFDHDDQFSFSLDFTLSLLGIDRAYFREGLRRWDLATAPTIKRRQPTVRLGRMCTMQAVREGRVTA